MTTVLGLKPRDLEVAVLVADRQGTTLNAQNQPNGKILGRKLWTGKNDRYCFGHVGDYDERTHDLVQRLQTGEIDVQKVLEAESFPELRTLNIKKMGRKVPDLQKLSGIVIATRYKNKPQLYTCYPFGDVEKRIWTTVGSGSEKVTEYMNALDIVCSGKDYMMKDGPATMSGVVRTGLEAVRKAQSEDLYSHGLDMLICTPEGVHDHFADLGDDFRRKFNKINREYNPDGSRKK